MTVAGQIGARSVSLDVASLRVYSNHTSARPPSRTALLLIFRDFHTYIDLSPPPYPSPADVPRESGAKKQPQMVLLPSSRCHQAKTVPHLAFSPPRDPRGPSSYSSGHRCETKTARPFSFVHVYRFRYSLIVMPRSTPATPFCLNAPKNLALSKSGSRRWTSALKSMLPPLFACLLHTYSGFRKTFI